MGESERSCQAILTRVPHRQARRKDQNIEVGSQSAVELSIVQDSDSQPDKKKDPATFAGRVKVGAGCSFGAVRWECSGDPVPVVVGALTISWDPL